MKILYCHMCDVRIDKDAVTADGRAFCSTCARKSIASARVSSGISSRFKATVRRALFSKIDPTESQRLFLGSATLPAQRPVGRALTVFNPRLKMACGAFALATLVAGIFCLASFVSPRNEALIEAAETSSQPPIAITEEAKVPVTVLRSTFERNARSKVITQ